MSYDKFNDIEPFSLGKTKGRGTKPVRKTTKSAKNDVEVYTTSKNYFNFDLYSNQKKVLNFIRSNEISVITADPGCGKTTIALYYALLGLKEKQFEQIVCIKPNVESGPSVGFLPGELDEKLAPFQESFIDPIIELVGRAEFQKLERQGKIVFKNPGFLRGKTLKYSCVIYDEFQNSQIAEIMTVITRKHSSSRYVVLGDFFQKDIRNSGYHLFMKIINGVKKVGHMDLDKSYQMRDELIVHLYENYKKEVLLKN